MSASVQQWPTVDYLVHTVVTRGGCTDSIFPTTLLPYHSATYPQGMMSKYIYFFNSQGMMSKYSLGGRPQ